MKIDSLVYTDDHIERTLRATLTAWATRAKTYSFLRAFMRKSSTLYVLDRAGDGTVALARSKVPDLLEHYLTRRAKGAELALKEHFDRELSPFTKNA
jgi:hypothetical protein